MLPNGNILVFLLAFSKFWGTWLWNNYTPTYQRILCVLILLLTQRRFFFSLSLLCLISSKATPQIENAPDSNLQNKLICKQCTSIQKRIKLVSEGKRPHFQEDN